MWPFDSSEEVDIDNSGNDNANVVIKNELHEVHNDISKSMMVITVILILFLAMFLIKYIVKLSKKSATTRNNHAGPTK